MHVIDYPLLPLSWIRPQHDSATVELIRHLVGRLARSMQPRPPLPSIPALDPAGQDLVATYLVKHYGAPGVSS